jgi:hypothetical protein
VRVQCEKAGGARPVLQAAVWSYLALQLAECAAGGEVRAVLDRGDEQPTAAAGEPANWLELVLTAPAELVAVLEPGLIGRLAEVVSLKLELVVVYWSAATTPEQRAALCGMPWLVDQNIWMQAEDGRFTVHPQRMLGAYRMRELTEVLLSA